MGSVYRGLTLRSTRDPLYLQRTQAISSRSLLRQITNCDNQTYNFYYTDARPCIPYACDYAHSAFGGQLLAVTDEDGRVTLIRTDKSSSVEDLDFHSTFYAHGNTVFDVKWSPNDQLLATASADKLMILWDVETQKRLSCFEGHEMSLKSVNWHPVNPNLLVTASKDGSFNIWDTRFQMKGTLTEEGLDLPMYRPIKSVKNAHSNQPRKQKKQRTLSKRRTPDRPVTSALFVRDGEEQIVSSGSYDGTIKLWDCRAGRDASPLEETTSGGVRGISDMKINSSGTSLFSICMDQSVYMHHLNNLSGLARRYTDPDFRTTSFYIKMSISHDDRFILSGSSTNSIFAWEIDCPKQKAYQFKGHSHEVSSVAWSKTSTKQFASCSDDSSVRLWNETFERINDR
ncbi:WD40-repeat-containing domain protein [Phycomyces blakesleeanus]|uniref:Uncharacterized protein n=2 Tax=Phycomyces blakesleeanus TaxID=4837 RepID=A0A167QT48_PHYB8|nr:hypothetical protein PHYBLDRAFT_59257 [Phycomyces blakesleeanus NRRL 1555(-)]OAD80230.1 hypothetical protein PHYBLDRAFT_59257 [Phycomyces blakesleeanus NRRL 1555(-)]|eukprot:XP_018298270.1 hypothetical protein PHYBLDRAFT_59257 [Phycomyces blakesleeanus NRRL 1555(-)]